MKRKRGKKLKSKWLLLVLFSIVVVLNVVNIFIVPERFSHTGFDVVTQATVVFNIEGELSLNIHSPENITYNFSIGDPLILPLNVTANSIMSSTGWVYSLYDLRHDEWVSEDVLFLPNTTFPVVRWGNLLVVNGTSNSGKNATANVTFFVYVPNSAPIIYNVTDQIYVCEGEDLFYPFYAIDVDEDDLNLPGRKSISPPGLFSLFDGDEDLDLTRSNFYIVSGTLEDKLGIGSANLGFGSYQKTISVTDGEYSDSVPTNITIIEINNMPSIDPLGVQTIWDKGDNSTLYMLVNFSDVEFTNYGYGALDINLSVTNTTDSQVVDLFNVSSAGEINFTANSSYVGVYDVEVCVQDTGLTNIHSEINRCSQNGLSNIYCDTFELTITNQNRAPTIISHMPDNFEVINISGTDNLIFNITDYDPDGTTPDTYWYVDGNVKEFDEGEFNDTFNYDFGCGVGGNHYVRVDSTDGELNDTLFWNFSISSVVCPDEEGSPSGGGGGATGIVCNPQWTCVPWNVCQNADQSLSLGILSGEDYRAIQDDCQYNALDGERCGFQIRGCTDLNSCNTQRDKPEELQFCLYTPNPTCEDGIKNCHDGDCELLVDCGGPCGVCASCTDNIQNQGEEGVDCGGPCPFRCEVAVPFLQRSNTLYIIAGILLVIIGFVVFKLIRVLKYKKGLESGTGPKI